MTPISNIYGTKSNKKVQSLLVLGLLAREPTRAEPLSARARLIYESSYEFWLELACSIRSRAELKRALFEPSLERLANRFAALHAMCIVLLRQHLLRGGAQSHPPLGTLALIHLRN